MESFRATRKQRQFFSIWICCCLVSLGTSVTATEPQSNFTWITEPVSQIVETGNNVTFHCLARYNKTVEYFWKFNDTVLNGTDQRPRFTIDNSNGTQLKIADTKQEDQGTYQCLAIVKGSNSPFRGRKVMLEVRFVTTEPSFTDAPVKDETSNLTWIRHPASQTVEKGSTVTFTCLADCDKLITYRWKVNNKTLDKDGQARYTINTNGTLEITSTTEEDRGIYQCFVTTTDGRKTLGESSTAKLEVKDQSEKVQPLGSMWKTAGIAMGCAIGYILFVVVLMLYIERRKSRKHNKRESITYLGHENLGVEIDVEDGTAAVSNCVAMNPVFSPQPTNDKLEFEFPKHDLVEMINLGNGSYGQAFLARASGIRDNEKESMVVVKSLRSKEERVRQEFNKEMEALCGLQHTNVVSLLGVCTLEEPAYIIFELMEKGDLKQFLISCYYNDRSKMDANKRQAICVQVLAGMNYLSSQNFVHKDLAIRNCMIGRDLKVKIGFLSLSCDLYSAEYYRFNKMQIPLRWMPPEAIFNGEFSEKSDVWSYGVLVWEIYTFGQMPYHDRSNEEVLECIKDDLRLPKPGNCPETVLEVLNKCWEGNPIARPTFQELADTSFL